MGVEPFLIASSLEGILAQRLVRMICSECKETYTPEPSEVPPDAGLDGDLWRGAGCRECRSTGYRGRVGIYELMTVSERTRELIMQRANAGQIAASALEAGDLTLLLDAGFCKVRSGATTVAEVLRAATS